MQKINLNEVKKYLKITNTLLQLIKTNDKINKPYFFKYHYFNLKIIYNFLIKLNNNWIYKPSINDCNKEIFKTKYNDNFVYFNLLDKKYTPTMKKSIFIFLALKPLLDKI